MRDRQSACQQAVGYSATRVLSDPFDFVGTPHLEQGRGHIWRREPEDARQDRPGSQHVAAPSGRRRVEDLSTGDDLSAPDLPDDEAISDLHGNRLFDRQQSVRRTQDSGAVEGPEADGLGSASKVKMKGTLGRDGLFDVASRGDLCQEAFCRRPCSRGAQHGAARNVTPVEADEIGGDPCMWLNSLMAALVAL